MKVVCLRTGGYHLTINKVYDVNFIIDNNLFTYEITNDIEYTHLIEGDIFCLLSDTRNRKLEELGI